MGSEHPRASLHGSAPRPHTARTRRALCVILAIAATIRLVNYLQIKDTPLPYLHHWAESDMHFYNDWARHIVAGDLLTDSNMRPYHSWHGHIARDAYEAMGVSEPIDEAAGRQLWNRWLGEKTFYEDPLYAYVLAGIYAVFGYDVHAVLIVQALLGVATVGLIFCLSVLLFDVPVASVAGLLGALFGPLIMYEVVLLRCALLTFAGLATLSVTTIAFHRPKRGRWFLLAGMLFGVTFLLKSSTLFFSAVAVAFTGYRLRYQGAWLRPIGMLIAGFLVAVSPLVVRNLAVGVAPLGIASSGAITFINHNAEDYVAESGDHLSVHAAAIMHRTDGAFLPAIVATLETHGSAASWLRQLWRKALAFWHWYEVPNNTSYDYFRLHASAVSAVAVDYYLIAPLAVLGLLLGLRRSYGHSLAALYIACGVATIVFSYSVSRFRVPIASAMIPFAAATAVSVVRYVRGRAYLKAAAILAATAALATTMLRPLPPEVASPFRTADFGVANEIAAHYAQRAAEAGDLAAAVDLLERQLETEPAELLAVTPRPTDTPISFLSASVSGSFAMLHELGATLNAKLGRVSQAQHHARRAEVLRIIASQLEQRKAGLEDRSG
jgi:4-amino-4-deoxy-L-arabinose transferase-like glycosyltransferase